MESRSPPPRILLVSRCGDRGGDLGVALRDRGYLAFEACCGDQALEAISRTSQDLVVLHTCGPGEEGLATLLRARAIRCSAAFLVIDESGPQCRAQVVRSMGTADYLRGPVTEDQLLRAIDEVLERAAIRREVTHHRWQARQASDRRMVGDSPAMQRVYDLIGKVADACVPVLISGETGTGKELAARALHDLSPRSRKPFVPVSCAAIPDQLIESTLFGHLRGSFTGAVGNQPGLLERADGGTVLLDDVESVSPALQGKLLRAVQERTIQRVGDRHDIPVDFRLVSATNVDLRERVQEGSFREDLFYRLNVFPIHMPPLRERPEDIPLLANHFRDEFASAHGLEALSIPECCMEWMMSHPWPGNVRELKHAVGRALLLSQGEARITCESLVHLWGKSTKMSWARPLSEEWSLERLERAYTKQVLEKTGGRKGEAARILGIDRRTLYRKLRNGRRQAAALLDAPLSDGDG